jgi:DNA-binding HxlR family transcriptional regulator
MYQRKITLDLDCGLQLTSLVLGGKWKCCILDAIHKGYERPADIRRYIKIASARVIEMQLAELLQLGVVHKTEGAGFPKFSCYKLSSLGTSLLPILAQMDSWGMQHASQLKPLLQENVQARASLNKYAG